VTFGTAIPGPIEFESDKRRYIGDRVVVEIVTVETIGRARRGIRLFSGTRLLGTETVDRAKATIASSARQTVVRWS
jgi:hypothetical protein